MQEQVARAFEPSARARDGCVEWGMVGEEV